ncbi:unnamed protein product [Durusdinium trenchii]|uniref:UDENN domain-containing protein n=1 Tax=Durusdinium trenchii TaxID=1381693 RepID=A0ABP0R6H4_9DINO
MFKKLQKLVPKDVKEAIHHAQAAISSTSQTRKAEPGLRCEEADDFFRDGGELSQDIFEIGDEDILVPLFEPLAEEDEAWLREQDAAEAAACAERSSSSAGEPGPPGVTFDRSQGRGPVAAILLIDFHHALGPVIEWAHPKSVLEESSSSAETCEDFPALDPWRAIKADGSPAVSKVLHVVASLALPDAAHREKEGQTSSVFFLVPCGNGQLLHGVSCHRRVEAAELLHRDASVSRGAVQKAVCVLLRGPFFGLVQQRLSPVTQVFFEQRDFRCTDLLRDFDAQLDSVPFEKLPETDLFFGIDHSRLFLALQHKLLSVLKAIMLEAKVLVISDSPEQCSRAVLAILSLLPGGLWLGFNSDGFGERHFQYQKHGFPIQCFGPRCCVYPYLGLQMLDSLLQMRGFLIGTTNRIFLERTSPHVVLEVPGVEDSSFSVDFLCKEIKELTRCTSAEKAWLLEASQRLEKAMPKEHAQASRPAVRPQDQDNDDDDELELVADAPHLSDDAVKRFDSEELVRDAQEASADAIAEVNTAALRQEHLLQETTWAATVDADRNAFAGYWIRLVVALAKTSGPERDFAAGLEVASRQEKSDLARFGLPFLQRWVMRTHGGQLWLQVHKLPVKERRPKPPREGQGTYRFSNGDEYRGEFRRGMRHGSGVYISQRNRMQYDGQWFRDRRHGNGTLTIEAAGKVLYTYDGQWQADKRHGSGSCVRCHKEKYSGQWVQNLYHGAGTFVDEKGALYEGEWRYGKFHGVGKHVCQGETYTGNFVDGERDGTGQLARAAAPKPTVQDFLGSESLFAGQWRVGQKHGHGTAIYALGEFEGQWVNGKRHGQAVLSYQGYQLEGPWVDDLPDEQASHMIFYPEGTKYTGRVRVYANGEDAAGEGRLWTPWNIVPEGEGMMKDPDGRLYEGQYQSGDKHGRGFAFSLDQSKYEGEFLHGERHGSGWLQTAPDQKEPTLEAKFNLRKAETLFETVKFVSAVADG